MSFVHDMIRMSALSLKIRHAPEDQQESEEHRARVAEHETLRLHLEKTIRRHPEYRELERFELLSATMMSVRIRFPDVERPIVWPQLEELTRPFVWFCEQALLVALERWHKLRLWVRGAMALSSLRSHKP
jgi:hypothetical protein